MSIEPWRQLRGNLHLKRALEISIMGNHAICIIGKREDGWDILRAIKPDVQLIEPCACGNLGSALAGCKCPADYVAWLRQSRRYRRALRSELIAELITPKTRDILSATALEPFDYILQRQARFELTKPIPDVLDGDGKRLLEYAINLLPLNQWQANAARRVACTLARMDGSEVIRPQDITEAIQYQVLPDTFR